MKRLAILLAFAAVAPLALAGPEKSVGKPLPKFSLTTTKGQKITNASLKGKVVLLDFWATWCVPCRQASPKIQELHEKYGSKGLYVLGADTGEFGKGTAAPYAKKHKYTYNFAEQSDKLAAGLGIQPIPVFVLVDKKGIVRKVWTGIGGGVDKLYTDIEAAAQPLLKG